MSTRRALAPLASEAGQVLPFALGMLAVLYLIAAGGFVLAWLEGRMSRSHRLSVEAFYLADAALQTYLGSLTDPPEPLDYPGPYPEALARVTARPVFRLRGEDRLYRVTARATVREGPEWSSRTLGQLVLLPGPPDPGGSVVALGGLEVSGGALVSGVDLADAPCAAVPDAAGAIVPAEGLLLSGGRLEGSPPFRETEDPATVPGVGRLAWPDPLNPSEGDGSEGEATAGEETAPPIRIVEADPALLGAADAGGGLLVTPGDVILDPGFRWEGLILAGGALHAAEDVRVEGGVIAGLRALTGEAAPLSTVGPGPVELTRHSCHLRAAARTLSPKPTAVPGTWREDF